jgi:hypothetical protein
MTFGNGLDREPVERVLVGPIVHFILEAVEQLPITDFRVNERGSGSEQHAQVRPKWRQPFAQEPGEQSPTGSC